MEITTVFDGSSNAVPDGVVVSLVAGNEGTIPVSNLTQGLPNGVAFTLKGKLPSGTPTAPKLPIVAGSAIFVIGNVTFVDDGSGWVGNVDPDHYCSGTLDYVTGAFSLVYPGTGTSGIVSVSGSAFSGNLVYPVQPGTVRIRAGELEAVDQPNDGGKQGIFTHDGSIGTIDYTTGTYSGTFFHAPGVASGTVTYCNNPPPTGATATVAYRYAKGPGRNVANNITDTLEAQWFVTDHTPLANCSNSVARKSLQMAIGAAERWSEAQGTDNTVLLLPAGTIHFGDRLNRIYIRKGHFSLVGSGTRDTCVAAWNGSGTQGSLSANRSIVIDDTASHVTLSNLKFDLQSNHADFRNSVSSSADNFDVINCEFGDSQAMTLGKTPATVSAVVSNWTSGSNGYAAQVQIASVGGSDLSWVKPGVDLQVYDASGTARCYASVSGTGSLATITITTDKLPSNMAANDRLEFYETFTRHALESDGSHVLIADSTFQNTQLRISTGDALLSEDITVNNCVFLDSQAYSISCVGRSRSDGTSQIRKDVTISNNVFTGFLRAAVYVGLDWGTAQYNGTVLDSIKVENNAFNITKAWRGEQVFRYHLGKSNRDLSWTGNTVTFVDRTVAAESCLHLINHASGNLRKGLFEGNTLKSGDPNDLRSFEHTMWLEATDEFLIAGNTIATGGDVYVWKGAGGVRLEDNSFTNARQVLRAENAGRVSLVGNSITTVNGLSTKMFSLSANNWNGGDITMANNLITLTGTGGGTSDLTQITESGTGHLSNVSLLNNNIIMGGRQIYSGTAAVTYALTGTANWSFDEGFGGKAGDGTTSAKQNASGNDLTLNEAAWARDRAALSFDGINDYAVMTANSSVNLVSDFSICAWVCPSRIDGYRTIVSKATDGNCYQYALGIYNGQLSFEQKNDGAHDAWQTSGTLQADAWHHVAVTSSSSNQLISLYIDGKLSGTFSGTLTPVVSGTTFEVGRLGGASPGSYYAGDIDDLQIHPSALSQGAIQAIAFGREYGYWRMNEGSGATIADESGLSNSGTRVGNTIWVTGVAGGTALQFDGSTGYVDVGHPANINITPPFTVEAWVYPTSTDTKNHTVISKNVDAATQMLDLSMKSGQLVFSYGGTLVGASGASNSWQHVAATVDSFGNAYLYCNGEIVASGTGFVPVNTGTASLNIGKRVGSAGANYFQGTIDDVEIYRRALWPDEVRTQAALP